MFVSFEGSTLHHGTTIQQDSFTGDLCPNGNIYGIHFGLSLLNLMAMRRIRIDQYMREMNITPKIKIRDNTVFLGEVSSLSSLKGKKTRSQIKFEKKQ